MKFETHTADSKSKRNFSTGVISSPNFPDDYPYGIEKTETIKVDEGMVISLKFVAFDIAHSSACRYSQYKAWDKLTITDGDGTTLMGGSCGSTADGNVLVGGQSLGSSLPADITSRSNVVNLVFNTNNHNNDPRSGWSISWRAVEPGEYCVDILIL